MIGLVVVSHSPALARAAVELAGQMVPADSDLRVIEAAGTAEGSTGTDAMKISAAIEEADSGDGVLVLLDLGSAVLSSELACEFLDPDLVERVRLSSAPLVEGLVAAVVTAAGGGSLDEVASEAESGLAGKIEHLGGPTTAAEPVAPPSTEGAVTDEITITNAHGLHARPVATLVSSLRGLDTTVELRNATSGRGPAPATSVTRVAALGIVRGHVLGISATGPDAALAVQRLRELAADEFGEKQAPAPAASPTDTASPAAPSDTAVLSGQQIVVAFAVVSSDRIDLSGYQPGPDEVKRASDCLERLRADLTQRQADDHGDIFSAQLAMVDDLAGEVTDLVAAGFDAARAIDETFSQAAQSFDQLADDYLRERAQDLRSLRRQLLSDLLGEPTSRPTEPHVLVVDELDAVTAAKLDTSLTLAVVTLTGGTTGHGVLVASSRGLPVLTGQADLHVSSGDLVAVDPLARRVWVNPDPEQLDQLRRRADDRSRAEHDARSLAHEPALTSAGAQILVEANVSSVDDARVGALEGADGSGLVRTELLFGDRTVAPTAAEQAETFVAIGRALGGALITIRTWDVGADKPLGFIPQDREANPFLGERGIRTMRRLPEVFDEQLRAIVMAHQQTPVRVMIPMVSSPDEMVWARERLDAVTAELEATGRGPVRPVSLGMMVEVPAAAVRAGDFAELVDFASIGTNDLGQYVAAADRTNGAVQGLVPQTRSAVFDLITMTCLGLLGLPVAVCGDLASDLTAVPKLVEAGVTELSVRPPMVALAKQAVRDC